MSDNKKFTDFIHLADDFPGDTGFREYLPVVSGTHTYKLGLGFIPTCTGQPTDHPAVPTGFTVLRMDTSTFTLYAYFDGEWQAVSGGGGLPLLDNAWLFADGSGIAFGDDSNILFGG